MKENAVKAGPVTLTAETVAAMNELSDTFGGLPAIGGRKGFINLCVQSVCAAMISDRQITCPWAVTMRTLEPEENAVRLMLLNMDLAQDGK